MRGNNPLRDAQAQATAVHCIAVRRVAAKKSIETRGNISGGIPGPLLVMMNSASFGGALQSHDHPALRLIVLDGVIREIEQQLPEPMSRRRAHVISAQAAIST